MDEARRYVSGTRDTDGSQYYMFFNDVEDLKNISNDEFDLFAKLRALRHYGYLEHIGIEFQKNDGSEFPSLRLSEGEKQLGLLLLLITFTSQHKCLYLFDEFDAYLHLNWQKAFSKMINNANITGYILLTTHSPATVSGMQRKNVFIMDHGYAKLAPSETLNRSLDEIMEEHMLVSMRPHEYNELVQEFRNAVMHGRKDLAEEALIKLREIVGETDPFFITARIALNRMG